MDKYAKLLPLGLFCLTIVNLMARPSWEAVGAAAVAALLAGAYELKAQDKRVKELEEKIEAEKKASELRYEVLAAAVNTHAKAFEDIKTHVSGLNLARNLKQSQQAAPMQKIF